jgi:hypothetical protein
MMRQSAHIRRRTEAMLSPSALILKRWASPPSLSAARRQLKTSAWPRRDRHGERQQRLRRRPVEPSHGLRRDCNWPPRQGDGRRAFAASANSSAGALAATALGFGATAAQGFGTVIGGKSTANNAYDTAIGGATVAGGGTSMTATFAGGRGSSATGASAVAIGSQRQPSGADAVASGAKNPSDPFKATMSSGEPSAFQFSI